MVFINSSNSLVILNKIIYNVSKSGELWEKVERRDNPAFVLYRKVERMFVGQFEHNIDEKGRLTVPAAFREELSQGAYITRGFDNNLIVLSKDNFEKLFQRAQAYSLTKPEVRDVNRLFFANAALLEFDKAGRILIPAFLRQSARLDGEAVVAGAGRYFEIWSKELWADKDEQLNDAKLNDTKFEMLDWSLGD